MLAIVVTVLLLIFAVPRRAAPPPSPAQPDQAFVDRIGLVSPKFAREWAGGLLNDPRAEIVEWEHRLRMQYLIRDANTRLRLTKGSTVQVAVSLESKLMCLQSPSILLAKLGVPEPMCMDALGPGSWRGVQRCR